jgi:dTDP-4-dehydrorhamnose reductase
MARRLLVTGASGLLGANLLSSAVKHFDAYGVYYSHPVDIPRCNLVQGDLSSRSVVDRLLNDTKPDIIVHSAALTNVDDCEENPQKARQVNVGMTEHLVRWTSEHGSKLVYISTDSVFDGHNGHYCENDLPNPSNVYAKTKQAAEVIVSGLYRNHLTVRTNIYGWNIQNKLSLSEWILGRLTCSQIVPGFLDVFFSPILVNDLCEILLQMVNGGFYGLYHVGSSQRISKAEFARELALEFRLNIDLVQDMSIDDFRFAAHRPKDTSLNVTKTEIAFGRKLPGIREGLKRFRELRESGFVSSLKGGSRIPCQ